MKRSEFIGLSAAGVVSVVVLGLGFNDVGRETRMVDSVDRGDVVMYEGEEYVILSYFCESPVFGTKLSLEGYTNDAGCIPAWVLGSGPYELVCRKEEL